MKILWISNTIFPAPSKELGIPAPVVGGWMYGMAMEIASIKGNTLAIATIYCGKKLKIFKINDVIYYLLPSKPTMHYQKKLENLWVKVCKEFNPNIIHIHGTEYSYGLACIRALPSMEYVVSIQGIIGIISNYYYSGISTYEILKNITFRDIVRFDTIFHAKRNFKLRGKFEEEYFHKICHVIGRTSWDFAHVKKINSHINYHFCNESLRDLFYSSKKWDINTKSKNTIFLSQADYPIKGLHQLLKAVNLLIGDFPNIGIRIAGSNITKTDNIFEKIKLSGYGSYIKSLLKKFDLEKKVSFIGTLSEYQMVNEYQNAHVFVCPSSIENSPNSLGEAQLIGTPVIASYVGGIPDMITHGETGLLYRFEEVEMLAENIRQVFLNDSLAIKISENEIIVAQKRHNREENLKEALAVYQEIIT
jgi:glycosyltransferase involved in cell wall biosynthesis